jgi:hypothetical protein
MEKIAYVVTETAGPKVAGHTVARGEELLLTEFEARAELIAGSLRPKSAEPAAETGAEPAAETTADEQVEEVTEDGPKAVRRRG